MSESLAILPSGPAKPKPKAKADVRSFLPDKKGGLLLNDPNAEECPYTFSDNPAYTRQKKAEEQAKRAAELEGKDETRGFLFSIEDMCRRQRWEEAYQTLERRTAAPSGLFLVARAILRWKFARYSDALKDAEEAARTHGKSGKTGAVASSLACFARICLDSEPKAQGTCSREMVPLVAAWEAAERCSLEQHAVGKGLFQPRAAERRSEPYEVIQRMEARDGTYVAATGIRIGYIFFKNGRDESAPVIVHFHGSAEVAADYRIPALAEHYRDLPAHLLVVDYRGYGWSAGQPSLVTLLRDAEALAEKLPELFIEQGLPWPYAGGLILSGRSIGAGVAVHLAIMFPLLFRALILDSAAGTSTVGDRLGKAPERSEALVCWRKELDQANLEVMQPLGDEFRSLGALDKIRAFNGQLLVLHGLQDEVAPFEGSESLHHAAASRQKELVLIEGAGHNDIGSFQEYWTAQRRFCLKVQLDDSLPSLSEKVQHLCAICAEKADSKCGRCQKVWYCSRKHQAEHWKVHKSQCAGGAPAPGPKAEPEADALLGVVCAAEFGDDAGIEALTRGLSSLAAQASPPHQVYVSWHAATESLAQSVREALRGFETQHEAICIVAVEAPEALQPFEHFRALSSSLAEAPAHLWVVMLELGDIWSPQYCASLVPQLKKSGADARVLAVSCAPRRAGPAKSTEQGAEVTTEISDSAGVEAAFATGLAKLAGESAEPRAADLAVRAKTLRAFVETTPAAVLEHELCGRRFVYKMSHTYGKKIQPLSPSEGEWMLWSQVHLGSSEFSPAHQILDLDLDLSKELFSGVEKLGTFASSEEAAAAVAKLRFSIDLKMTQWAGEQISAKDLRTVSIELVNAWLQEHGLDAVVGVQRWAKDAAAALSQASASALAVSVERR